MAKHVLLDNITHKDLKIITDRAPQYGDAVASIGVFPVEFRQVQAEYPIVFRKSAETGRFDPVALFGMATGENLFLDENGWDAGYIPLAIQRQPFLIGVEDSTGQGELAVHVDMDSPRISRTQGEAVFLEFGGNSPYLERMTSVLLAIHQGHAFNQGFTEALTALELLEPFVLEVELQDQSVIKLAGFYTLNEDRLSKLDGNSVARLHAAGYLEPMYMALASLPNFRALIARKNRRLAQ